MIPENTWIENIMLQTQLRYYIKNEMMDSITFILEGDESPLAASLLSALAASQDDFTTAEAFASNLDGELSEAQGYSAILQTIGLQLLQDSLTWIDLDSLQIGHNYNNSRK